MHRRSKESPKVTDGVRDEADTMKDDSGCRAEGAEHIEEILLDRCKGEDGIIKIPKKSFLKAENPGVIIK